MINAYKSPYYPGIPKLDLINGAASRQGCEGGCDGEEGEWGGDEVGIERVGRE